jgi:hypothetical protein
MTRLNIFTGPRPEDLQPVDWITIDAAIYDWLNDLLDMQDRIIWEDSNEPAPERYPYLSLKRTTIASEGGIKEEIWRTIDENGDQVMDDTQTPVINEHIIRESVAFTLSISAYVDREADMENPLRNAEAILAKAKASLGLNGIRDAFDVAGIAVIDDMDIVDSSVVINADYISRATLDIIFRAESAMTEQLGYVDKTELTSDLGVDETIDAS